MKKKCITYILLALLVIFALIFFIFGMNEIIGIIFLILAVAVYASNNSKWGNKFKESLGIAIFSGLIVSLVRDISSGTINPSLKVMYFIGLGIAVLLLSQGASKGEKI